MPDPEATRGRLKIVGGGLIDRFSLDQAIHAAEPDEAYDPGTQSFFARSLRRPVLTGKITVQVDLKRHLDRALAT